MTICILLACLVLMMGCTTEPTDTPVDLHDAVSLVPVGYRHQLVQRLGLAEERREQWLDAIRQARPEDREAVAFLLVHMPEQDLRSLTAAFVLRNVELAYEARGASAWGRAVPHELFLSDVLPYANLNERRDEWRGDFHARFGPLVKNCRSASEAAQLLNREIFKALKVEYHATKRQKPDQSPYESIQIGYASCTGLSILLVDACRAVGVPARVAGTPRWTDHSGNHTWVEVWDGRWWFIGAAEPGLLNKTWFVENAAKADASRPEHRIYAASFQRTELAFPMVWDGGGLDFSAVDVTASYTGKSSEPTGVVGQVQPDEGDWARMRAITPRGYVCPRATGEITIDGRGDEPAWAAAPWTEDFVDIEGDRRPAPRFRTRAKMLWDDEHFYIYAEMDEPHVWATITTKNDVIFHDNDFEVFIDPDGDNHNYYEFEVNAFNTIWELTLDKPYRNDGPAHHGTNIDGLRSAVHVRGTINDPSDTDRGWSVEMAIPWRGLARYAGVRPCPPRDGEQWRINFSRVQWLVDIIDGQYRKIPREMRAEDNWVWSPQGVIDMHRPERWGYVQFSASAGTATLCPDPMLAARDTLMGVYYRQREYHKRQDRYADSTSQLGMADDPPVVITATSSGYTAMMRMTLSDGTTRTLSLRDDSLLREE